MTTLRTCSRFKWPYDIELPLVELNTYTIIQISQTGSGPMYIKHQRSRTWTTNPANKMCCGNYRWCGQAIGRTLGELRGRERTRVDSGTFDWSGEVIDWLWLGARTHTHAVKWVGKHFGESNCPSSDWHFCCWLGNYTRTSHLENVVIFSYSHYGQIVNLILKSHVSHMKWIGY